MLPFAFLLQGAGAVFFLALALILLGQAIEKVAFLAMFKGLKPFADAIGWLLLVVYFVYQVVIAAQAGKWF